MPSTWGFGIGGAGKITAAGWGYLADYAGQGVILLHTTTAERRTHATTAERRTHATTVTRRTHDIDINEP